MTDEKLILEALSWLMAAGDYRNTTAKEIHTKINDRLAEMAGPTVMEVYGENLEQLKPPAGHRFTKEFRARTGGEWYMSVDNGEALQAVNGCECDTVPRLILVKCKRLVFDVVGEWNGTRPINFRALIDHYIVTDILSEPRVEE